MSDAERVEAALDYYVDQCPERSSLMLLKALSYPSQGGFGYRIELGASLFQCNGYSVDERGRTIKLDRTAALSDFNSTALATALKLAVEDGVFGKQRSLTHRVAMGAGKVILGVVETALGLIKIVIPEPGTTMTGVVLSLAGANLVDVLDRDADPIHTLGEHGFHLGSLPLGSAAAIRILQVPHDVALSMGSQSTPLEALGRPDLWRGLPRQTLLKGEHNAVTILEIDDRANRSLLRYVIQLGKLFVNGQLVGDRKVTLHETNWKVTAKSLLHALWQPTKLGR